MSSSSFDPKAYDSPNLGMETDALDVAQMIFAPHTILTTMHFNNQMEKGKTVPGWQKWLASPSKQILGGLGVEAAETKATDTSIYSSQGGEVTLETYSNYLNNPSSKSTI